MGKKGFEYEIRGYRYAPESFRAFKGLPGQKMEQIPLSGEQRRKMGYEVFTPNFKEALLAKHTPTLRKLTCPCCGHKGFCVETYRKKENENG